jgi:hypothetical protein
MLAITALDVAFASAIVAALAAVSSPLVAWSIARATRDHERTLSREARNYEARREVYLELLLYCQRKAEALEAYLAGDEPPDYPPDEEMRLLKARVSLYCSEEVLALMEEFDAASLEAFKTRPGDGSEPPEEHESAHARTVETLRELERTGRIEVTGG